VENCYITSLAEIHGYKTFFIVPNAYRYAVVGMTLLYVDKNIEQPCAKLINSKWSKHLGKQ